MCGRLRVGRGNQRNAFRLLFPKQDQTKLFLLACGNALMICGCTWNLFPSTSLGKLKDIAR
jgi:hypothetical protein